MKFYSRKLIKPTDLNANNSLFGGKLLQWIDEEAGIYAMSKLGHHRVVTKYMSEINFVSSAYQAEVVEIGIKFQKVGTTSISFSCEVRTLKSLKTIITIQEIVFVLLDEKGKPQAHGKTNEDILNESKF